MDNRSRLQKTKNAHFSSAESLSINKRSRSSTPSSRFPSYNKTVKFNKEIYERTFGGTDLISAANFDSTTSTQCSDAPGAPSSPNMSVRRTISCENPSAIFQKVTFPTYDRRSSESINSKCNIEINDEEDCRISVAVRVRPLLPEKENDAKVVVSMEDKETIVNYNGTVHRFAYEYSFWSMNETDEHYVGQKVVYEALAKPLIGLALKGFNTCLLAYGQTSSGKSYSMMGEENNLGVIPRFITDIFLSIDNLETNIETKIELSFYEIYNEKIYDLLIETSTKTTNNTPAKKQQLRVREHRILGPYVEGLSTFVVQNDVDALHWFNHGLRNRAMANTSMNDLSSRSHAVFTLVLTQTKRLAIDNIQQDIVSRINLVDLAGSERTAASGCTGDRLQEGKSINLSLMTLGKVITQLSAQSSRDKGQVFPYRESNLTWLLRDSLGGNSKTVMLATISPASANYEETLSTLRYAQKARKIVNVVRINEDKNVLLIRKLLEENAKLKAGLDKNVIDRMINEPNMKDEIDLLKAQHEEQIIKLQAKIKELQLRLEESEGKNVKESRRSIENMKGLLDFLNEEKEKILVKTQEVRSKRQERERLSLSTLSVETCN